MNERVNWIAWMLRSGVLFVLRPTGYFDEAGIHSQSLVIAVAGYVSPLRDWRRLEIKWEKALRHEGVCYYHATEIEANPPRGIYEGWSRERADKLTDRVVSIAAEYGGRPFGVNILARDWYAALPFVKTYLPNRPHDGAYLLLAKICIESVVKIQAKEHPNEPIGFVFAENDYTQQLVGGYQIVKSANSNPSLFGHFGLDEAKANVMLQASDLLAWQYRSATEIYRGLRQGPVHRAAKFLMRHDGVFLYMDRHDFRAQVRAIFERYGAEWSEAAKELLRSKERQRQERKERGEAWRRGNTS